MQVSLGDAVEMNIKDATAYDQYLDVERPYRSGDLQRHQGTPLQTFHDSASGNGAACVGVTYPYFHSDKEQM
jgi:hypothetical protein